MKTSRSAFLACACLGLAACDERLTPLDVETRRPSIESGLPAGAPRRPAAELPPPAPDPLPRRARRIHERILEGKLDGAMALLRSYAAEEPDAPAVFAVRAEARMRRYALVPFETLLEEPDDDGWRTYDRILEDLNTAADLDPALGGFLADAVLGAVRDELAALAAARASILVSDLTALSMRAGTKGDLLLGVGLEEEAQLDRQDGPTRVVVAMTLATLPMLMRIYGLEDYFRSGFWTSLVVRAVELDPTAIARWSGALYAVADDFAGNGLLASGVFVHMATAGREGRDVRGMVDAGIDFLDRHRPSAEAGERRVLALAVALAYVGDVYPDEIRRHAAVDEGPFARVRRCLHERLGEADRRALFRHLGIGERG